MLPGKRPLSRNDDREKYWNAGATPANSPRKCRCIQKKDLSLIVEKYKSLNMDTKPSPQTSIPSFGKGDLQKEVIKSLKKIPSNLSPNVTKSPQFSEKRNDVPNVTVTTNFQSPVRTYQEFDEDCVLDFNDPNLSENLNEMDYEPDSSFNDRLSTMATCPSERSINDSLSDFENYFSDDENFKHLQSMSLDDRKCKSPLYLACNFDEFKGQKTASLDDLQDISSNYHDLELTL